MTFLAPLMLIGGVAVSIPIAVHFFFKARYKPLPWGPMKFLREAIEQTSQRIKFQEWILLALRCLVILLLALALARPGVTTAGTSGRGEAIDAVLVIDNSYSMGAQDGDRTRLERAKDAALQVIDSLPVNSTVQVYTCSDRAVLLGPPSRSNLDQARELVKTVRTCGLATDFTPGLTDALKSAANGASPVKEVYLFSDLQKLGFEQKPADLRARCEEIKAKGNLVFVRCSNPERRVPNVAVTDVRPNGRIAQTNVPTGFTVVLRNTGTEPVRGVKVGLEMDGRAVTGEVVQVDVEPGVHEVSLTGGLVGPGGARLLTARVTGDGLAGDNRYDKLILVHDRVRVLIVDGNLVDRKDPRLYGADFVEIGLNPGQPSWRFRESELRVPGKSEPFVRVTTRCGRQLGESERKARNIDPANLVKVVSPADLTAGQDLVFLCDVPVPSPGRPASGVSQEFVDRLAEFVRDGGGLVIGCGDYAKVIDPGGTPAYNRVLGSGGAGLLPYDLAPGTSGLTDAAPAGNPFHPSPATIPRDKKLHVGLFQTDDKARARLQEVRVFQVVRLAAPPPDALGPADRAVLLRLDDHDKRPLLVSRDVGEGRVQLLTTTLDERKDEPNQWTDFAGIGAPAFVPFCQVTMADLIGRRLPGGNQTAGERIVWYPRQGGVNFEVVLPVRPNETSPRRVRLGQPLIPSPGDRMSVTVPAGDTTDPGVYRIVRESNPPTPEDPTFALNPDLRESENLDVASDADVANAVGFAPTIIQAGATVEAVVTQTRARREWTEWLLLGLLLLLIGESVWAWFCGRAW
jgi:hypothetical protein